MMLKKLSKWTARQLPGVAVALCILATGAVLLSQRKAMGLSGWTSVWDYDGKKILGHLGNDVYLWDARTARLLHKFVGHGERIRSVQFSPDGKHALTDSAPSYSNEACHMPQFRSKDTSVRLWDLDSGGEVWKIEGHLFGVFSPDGQRLLTFPLVDPMDACGGGGIAGLAMWDVATKSQLFLVKRKEALGSLAFSPDGRTILHFRKSVVSTYDAKDGSEIGRLENIDSASFSGPNGDVAISPFLNRQLEVWDSTLRTRKLLVPTGDISWIAWTPDGSRMFQLAGSCRAIGVWAVNSGQMLYKPACDPDVELYSNSILASPDNKRLLLWVRGYAGGGPSFPVLPTLELYDLDTGRKLAKIPKSGTPIGFSPDGQTFLVGGTNAERPSELLQLDSFYVYGSDSGEPIVTLDLEHGLAR